MLFKNIPFTKGVEIIGYGVASFFLYRITNHLYLKYSKKYSKRETTEEDSLTGSDGLIGSDKKKEIPYSYKYYEKFEKMPVNELSKEYIKSLLNNVLFENTPKGNVIMYYDYTTESFIYYCDVTLSFKYLETVVRKYAINFNCKKLVVDSEKEIKNATIKYNELISSVKNTDNKVANNIVVHNSDSSVFASFKSYNRKGSGGSKNLKKKYIVCELANRYSFRGKISSYNFLKKNEYKNENIQSKMDYKTFKTFISQSWGPSCQQLPKKDLIN